MSSTISAPTAASSTAAPTQTGNGNGGGGGPSSPLLFFVALGFGVVFTNLWIIVGVKYCFRYNQRNRARLAGEDPDAVDMTQMPRQRRRREKKLMTIDEVNERFPLIKYKTWRSARADQGLPTAGGITSSASRPASIRDQPGTLHDKEVTGEKVPSSPVNSEHLLEKPARHASAPGHGQAVEVSSSPNVPTTSTETTTDTPKTIIINDETTPKTIITKPEPAVTRNANDEEVEVEVEGDRIQTAIPAEQLPDPGDTCAICIDVIEDEDDIRGLSCGHAFHASCVDPWLTSRRACCPLCKADYYVPKPRPEPTQTDSERRHGRAELQQVSPFSLITGGRPGYRRGRPRDIVLLNPHRMSRTSNNHLSEVPVSNPPQMVNGTTTSTPEISEQNTGRRWQRFLPSLPALSRTRRDRGNDAGSQPVTIATDPTPAQLEAGSR